MKKFMSVLLVCVIVFALCSWEHCYTRENCNVVRINNGLVTMEDGCGFRWKWEIEEGENFVVGDKVDLKMHDGCTNSIVGDDEIVRVIKR